MFPWNEAAGFSIMLNLALKGTFVLAGAWLAAACLRRHSASARHLAWSTAAAALLALPLLSFALPSLLVPAAPALLSAVPEIAFRATTSTPASPALSHALPRNAAIGPLVPATSPASWTLLLALLWSAGAIASFAQMTLAYVTIARIRRSGKPFADDGLGLRLTRALGIHKSTDIVEAPAGSMPMTFGLLRATVLLPADAVNWTEERRRIVLLHELAHVQRGDAHTQLLARTALALYWWNPLAWVAWRASLKERERAADDLVLATGARASEYAGHLLAIARSMQSSPAHSAAIAMARGPQLESRLKAILDAHINRRTPARASACVAILLALAAVAPLAALRAQERQAPASFGDVDTAIRVAVSQQNYEMLEQAAQAATQLDQRVQAQRMLEAALSIRGARFGEKSPEYADGLLKLAALAWTGQQKASAREQYTRAAQLLGESPHAAQALLYLGIDAIGAKDYARAFEQFERAERIAPGQAGTALMWMAVVRQRENQPAEAAALYRSALSIQPPDSPEVALITRLYAALLRDQGNTAEADALTAREKARQSAQTPPSPAAAATSAVYHAGAPGVTAPAVLQKVEPEYSDEGRAAALTGSDAIYVEIGPDGIARNAQVVRRLGLGLDEKALQAIRQWRFKPATKDGQPVTIAATIEVNWRLF